MQQTPSGLNYTSADLRPPWRASGLPVVFHHGIGTSLEIWSEWVPIVSAHHPVVRFDMRGFGASAVPPEDHRWSMDQLVADLWEVAASAGAERVHLAGESIGGTIVLAAAAASPDRVASVTISNASYKGEGLGQIEHWRAQFADGGTAGWAARMMENRFTPGAGVPAALAWFGEEQARTRSHVALGLAEVLAAADLTDAVRGMNVPLSIVLPDSSPFVPVKHGAELRDIAPDARLRVVPGTRHGLPFTHAREEAEWLVRFLAEVEG